MSVREKLRVLVVDDMSTSRGLLLQGLDALGIRQVEHVEDGEAAMESLVKRPVHLVLSDYNMPRMDGLGLLKAIRSHATLGATGFVLVSGRADPDVIASGRRLKMNNFLTKPFDHAALRSAIEAVVGRL